MIAISHRPGTLPDDFYVYAHRRATTGEIFYIGKGHGNRAWAVHATRSKLWRSIATKHGVAVEILISGLQEWAAHEIEVEKIALHGRRDCRLGPLVNLTDGGEGCVGLLVSDETRSKIVAANKGQKRAPWDASKREKCLHIFNTPEGKAARAQATANSWKNQQTKTKRSIAISTAKKKNGATDLWRERIKQSNATPVICKSNNMVFASMTDARDWLRSIGHTKACTSSVHDAINGRSRHAYGLMWSYA